MRGIAECGFAPDLWVGRVGNVCLARVEIDPPSSVAVATASPRGEAIYTLCEHGKQLCEHGKQLCEHSKQKCEQNKQNFEKPIELQEQTGL